MPINFLSLPRELRDQIYGLVLLQDETIINPRNLGLINEGFTPRSFTNGLFRVNKTICYEATSLFYSQICFDLTFKSRAWCFEQIGRNNADCIRHVWLDFPAIHCRSSGHPKTPGHRKIANVILDHKDVSLFKNMQRSCTNLSTVKAFIYAWEEPWRQLKLDLPENRKIVSEAFKLVNTHFKAVSSLRKIVIDMAGYFGELDDYIRREMESYGWILK